jgi:hypothetical protein
MKLVVVGRFTQVDAIRCCTIPSHIADFEEMADLLLSARFIRTASGHHVKADTAVKRVFQVFVITQTARRLVLIQRLGFYRMVTGPCIVATEVRNATCMEASVPAHANYVLRR